MIALYNVHKPYKWGSLPAGEASTNIGEEVPDSQDYKDRGGAAAAA